MSSWIPQIFCCSRPVQSPNDLPEHKKEKGEEEEKEAFEQTVITDQPEPAPIRNQHRKQRKESQVILCCSSDVRDDQIDLCPTFWYREFLGKGEQRTTCLKIRRFLWRLCFLVTCLPLCYPCYMSRSVRRRRKHRVRYLHENEPLKAGGGDKFNNQLNQTIQRQLTKKSANNTTFNLNVINVNVIIMHSPASNILHQYLRTSIGDSLDGATHALPLMSSGNGSSFNPTALARESIIRKKSVNAMANFASNLSSVPEEESSLLLLNESNKANEENEEQEDEPVIKLLEVPITRGRTEDETDVAGGVRPFKRHSNAAFRRKSSISARFSKLRKYSFSRQRSQEENGEVVLRKDNRRNSHLRRRHSHKLSVVSGSSMYYSFDSDSDSEGNEDGEGYPGQSVEMVTLGQRTMLLKDLDFEVAFKYIDEATVADWKGKDLKQAKHIPNIDILLLAVRKDNVEELSRALDLHTGIMGYISKFWRGFFPILIIELETSAEHPASSIEDGPGQSNEDESSSKYLKRMAQVQALFGDVYKIQMREHQLIDNLDWLNETVARLFVHARVYQCPRFHGPDVIKHSHLRDSWSCPGGCGLRKAKHKLKKSKLSSII